MITQVRNAWVATVGFRLRGDGSRVLFPLCLWCSGHAYLGEPETEENG